MDSDHQYRIVKALEKYQAVQEQLLENAKRVKEAPGRAHLSYTERLKLWFSENRGKAIRPHTWEDHKDINGDPVWGLPRIPKGSLRSALKKLRDQGIIRYYWDGYNCRHSPPWVEYNDCLHLFDEGTIPEVQFHGLLWHVQNPRHQVVTRKGKSVQKILDPEALRDILLNCKDFVFSHRPNGQHWTYTYETDWNDRKLVMNIHKGKSSLIEVSLECTHNPISLEEFLNLDRDLHIIWGDIWIHSDTYFRNVGINRDFRRYKLEGIQGVKRQYVKDFILRVYQKGQNVRSESHLYGLFPAEAVPKAIERGIYDTLTFKSGIHIERLEKKVTDQSMLIETLQKRLEEMGQHQLSQSVSMATLADNVSALIKLLNKPLAQEESHSSFVRADDYRSYG